MNVFALQVDSNLTSFVTALSEISSVTDPVYGPESIGEGETQVSSLTDPTYSYGTNLATGGVIRDVTRFAQGNKAPP